MGTYSSPGREEKGRERGNGYGGKAEIVQF